MPARSGGLQISGFTSESVYTHRDLEEWPEYKMTTREGPRVRAKQQTAYFTIDQVTGGNPGDWILVGEGDMGIEVCTNAIFGELYAAS